MLSPKPAISSKPPSLKTQHNHPLRPSGTHLLHVGRRRPRPTSGPPAIRAVISSDDKNVTATVSSRDGGLKELSEAVEVRAVLTVRNKLKQKLVDRIEDQWEYFVNGIGQGILVQLVSEEIDPATNSGKRSVETSVRGWLPKPSNHPSLAEYAANFTVPPDFGRPGAIIITNLHDKEFHLMEIIVHGFPDGPIFFPSNTWIHSCKDSTESRIIFTNRVGTNSATAPHPPKMILN